MIWPALYVASIDAAAKVRLKMNGRSWSPRWMWWTVLAALALLLTGCGAQPQRPVSPVEAAIPVLVEAAGILEDVHAALDAAQREAIERAVRAETTTEAKHAAIDRVDAAWRPIWDVYARARDAYVTAAALARTAALAEKAGQHPSPGRVAVATGALVLAVEELTRAVESMGSTRGATQ